MEEGQGFPTTHEVRQELEAGDVMSALKMVNDPLKMLLEKEISELTDWEVAFAEQTLPSSFRSFANLEKPLRKLWTIMIEFNGNYISLVARMRLNVKLLEPLAGVIEAVSQPIHVFDPVQLSDDEKNELLEFNSENFLREEHPQVAVLKEKLIVHCCSSGLFRTAVKMLSCNEGGIEAHQLALILRIFRAIEPYLAEDLISALLPALADEALKILIEKKADFEGLCRFLTEFVKMVPDKVEEILELFCSFMTIGPIQSRFAVTSDVIDIAKRIAIKPYLKLLKASFMQAAGSFSNEAHLSQVCSFLPYLAERLPFTEADLCQLLDMNHLLSVDERCNLIQQIMDTMKRKKLLDTFGKHLLESNIFAPRLYCLAIERSSPSIAASLFDRLTQAPREQLESSLSSMVVDTKVIKLIRKALCDAEDPALFQTLSYFLSTAEDVDDMEDFIAKTIELAEQEPSLIKILQNFSKKISEIEADGPILQLAESAFTHYENQDSPEFVSSAFPILAQWMEGATVIPEEPIYKRLRNVDYSQIPNELPRCISTIVKKTKDKRRRNEVLMKMVDDTVEPKFSHWAVDLLFSQFHDDKDKVETIARKLFDHLDDDNKRLHAIFMIQRCVQYEADFFRVGDSNVGSSFSISLHGPKQCEVFCGLHPYHTCRRIYAEVQRELNLTVDKFQLSYLTNRYVDRCILASTPLSVIIEDYDPLVLNISLEATAISEFQFPTFFMTYLDEEPELLNKLYSVLGEKELEISDVILEILQLFVRPEHSNFSEPVNALQGILWNNCANPLEFADNPRIFPSAVVAYSNETISGEMLEQIILTGTNQVYDQLNMIALSKGILKLSCPDFVFSEDLIRKCLIESPHECLRKSILRHYTNKNDMKILLKLIPMVIEKQYRSRSEQFLECFQVYENLSSELFMPFYRDLNQYEGLNEVDQTFISLLSLIPKTEESVKLTYDRLSVPPTVKSPNNPFVHSESSRRAAFEFLLTDKVFPELLAHMSNLPTVPSQFQKFSDDFTPKGRNGISNLGSTCYINALMQSLNTLNPFVFEILRLPTEGLSPFMLQFRDFLANLRYSRGASISIQALVDQIPNFDAFIQEDAEEFLNHLINRVLEELTDLQSIKEQVEGTRVCSFRNDKEVFSSHSEDFYAISLPTKGLSSLSESYIKYFADEKIEGGYSVEGRDDRVEAYRHVTITRWPHNIIIQLQRGDYRLDTGEGIKLVHEFGFPTQLRAEELASYTHSSPSKFNYTLSAVVVHEGDPESGHYYAIVDGDNGEWYLCDDFNITPFDIGELSKVFGVSEEMNFDREKEIATGYLLFYRQSEQPKTQPVLPEDLEDRINKENEASWPSTFFFSHEFVDFAMNLITKFPGESAFTLALTVFFKVVVVDDALLRKWKSFMTREILTSQPLCCAFFKYIEDQIGTNLGTLVSLSDTALEVISAVVLYALGQVPDTTKPLLTILKGLDFYDHRRCFSMAFDVITAAIRDLSVSWKDEEEVLGLMVDYVTCNLTKELLRTLRKQHGDAVESVLGILKDVVLQKGVIAPVSDWFNAEVLNRLAPILRKSDNFQDMAVNANSIQPGLLAELEDVSPQVQQLLRTGSVTEKSTLVNLDPSFLDQILPVIAFGNDSSVSERVCDALLRVMPRPDAVVEKYIKKHITEPDLLCPSVPEESSLVDLIISLIPQGLRHSEFFEAVAELLMQLSIVAPFGVSGLLPDIVNTISQTSDEAVLCKFMIVVKNMVVYDESLIPQVREAVLRKFLGLNYGCEEAVQLIWLFKEDASGSPLFSSCITKYLDSVFNAYSTKLIQLLESGLNPGNFVVPASSKDPLNVQLAVALLKASEWKKDELAGYLLSIFENLHPRSVFMTKPVFKEAAELLSGFCPEKFASLGPN